MPEEEDGRNRPRIGFLITELGAGGAEKVVFELARRLDRKRFDVAGVMCLGPAEGFYAGELDRVGVPVYGCGARGAIDAPWALLRLRKAIAGSKLDLLHAHLFHASAAAHMAAPRRRVPHLVVTHHFNEPREGRFRFERMVGRRPSAVTAVSRSVADRVARGLKLGSSAVRVIPNGVDAAAIESRARKARGEARRRLRLPEDVRVIGTVGRLSPEKDPLTLLEAFARLAREDQSLRLVYVGDGDLHEAVHKRIGELGLRERARVVGFWSDVPAALAALDVFVLTSITEGHPLALLEAMAAGRPVVASRIPAVLEVLGPVEEGALTCAPGSSEQFAAAIRKLLDDRVLAAGCAAAAAARVAGSYDMESMLEAYEGLFAELLELPPAATDPDRSGASGAGRRKGLTAPYGKL